MGVRKRVKHQHMGKLIDLSAMRFANQTGGVGTILAISPV
jgi:hypothetical protein